MRLGLTLGLPSGGARLALLGLFAQAQAATFSGAGGVRVTGTLAAQAQAASMGDAAGLVAQAQAATFTGAGGVRCAGSLSAAAQAATFSGTGTVASGLVTAQGDLDARYNITPHTNTFSSGTTPPAVTLTKTGGGALAEIASSVPGLRVEITTLGAVGVAVFRVSYDNGATWAHSLVLTASTYALDGTATGITLNFAAGTYATDNVYEMRVGSWTSKEGNAYVFSNVTGNQCPVYRGVDAGAPYLQFDASDDSLECTTAGAWNWLQDSPAFTLISKVKPDSFNAIRCYFSVGNSGSTNSERRFGTTTTSSGRWFENYVNSSGTAGTAQNSATVPTNADHVLSWKSPGTTLTLYVDGTIDGTIAAASHNPGTLTPNRARVGCRCPLTPSAFWGGKIYRIVWFTSALSDSDRGAWETEVAA